MSHVKTGALIAFAAGSLFASACEKKDDKAADKPAAKGQVKTEPTVKTEADKPDPAATKVDPAAEKVAQVDCAGVNECKGQGTCKTDKHGCGGQNACKGQGVLAMSEAECKEKGGTIAAH